MKCEHANYDEYFEKCIDCGAQFEQVMKEEMRNCSTPEHARELAIHWQQWQAEQSMSYGEVMDWYGYIWSMAVRNGLRKEFKENGIL